MGHDEHERRLGQGAGSISADALLRVFGGTGWTLSLCVILVLGGANWTLPTARFWAELAGCAILVAALWQPDRSGNRMRLTTDWLLIGLLLLFIIHLAPLPPQIWPFLPGRDTAALVDRTVFGSAGWRPLTLDPEATWRSLLMLVPAIGTYLAVRRGDSARHGALLRGVAIASTIAIAIGFLQFVLGGNRLTFYPEGDYDYAVGFFTNRNHQAAFLLAALPLSAAWLSWREAGVSAEFASAAPMSGGSTAALAGLTLLTGAAVLATASRAGFALLPLCLVATWLGWTERMDRSGNTPESASDSTRRVNRWLLMAGILALMVIGFGAALLLGGDGASAALNRGDLFGDQRFMFWPPVANAAMQFWPVGSGIGTFLNGFEMFEPIEILGPLYLNHAHNDFLEIFLEAGVPGLVLVLVALYECAIIAFRAWRQRGGQTPLLTARMAAAAVVIPVLHSLVDYPLRTIAISTVMALALGLLGSYDGATRTGRKSVAGS